MADNENQVGGVSVAVNVDLTQYHLGMAQAEAEARRVDATITQSMGNITKASVMMTQQERLSVNALISTGATLDQVTQAYGKNAAGRRILTAFTEQLQAADARAMASATGIASAETAAAVAIDQRTAASIRAASTTVPGAGVVGGTTRAATTADAQMAAQLAPSAMDTALLRTRVAMTKQAIAEEVAATAAGAKQEESIAASTLALQTRMNRQRLAEETATTRAVQREEAAAAKTAEDLAKRKQALLTAANPALAVESKLNATRSEANALLAQGVISEGEHAEVLAAGAAKAAIAAKAMEELSHATINGRVSMEAFAAIHEIVQGRLSRLPGTLMVLSNAMAGASGNASILSAVLSPIGLIITAIAAATIGAAADVALFDNSLKKLQDTTAGLGRASGLTSAQIEAAAQASSSASTRNILSARTEAEAFAAAGVKSGESITQLGIMVDQYSRLTGEKATKATQDLARAMEDPAKAGIALAQKFGDLDDQTRRLIQETQASGDKFGAQSVLLRILSDDFEKSAGHAHTAEISFQNLGNVAVLAGQKIAELTGALVAFGEVSAGAPVGAISAQKRADDAARAAQERARGVQYDRNQASLAAGTAVRETTGRGDAQSEIDTLREHQAAMATEIRLENHGAKGTVEGLQHAYQATTETIDRLTAAQRKYGDTAQRDNAVLRLQVEEREAGRDKAARARIEQERAALQFTGHVETNEEVAEHARLEGQLAAARTPKGPKGPKDTFTPKEASVVEDTAATLDLAEAYGKSAAAALKAEATRKALTDATLHHRTAAQADLEVQNQINLAVAKDIADLAKKTTETERHTAAQNAATDALLSGSISAKDAERSVQKAIELGPLQAAADIATGRAKDVATEAVKRHTAALAAESAAQDRSDAAKSIDKSRDELDIVNLQVSLVSATRQARDVALARARKAQDLGVGEGDRPTAEQAQAIDLAGQVAQGKGQLGDAEKIKQMTDAVEAETMALRKQHDTFGMTKQAAATYEETQKLLNEATKDGIQLTDAQRQSLMAQAQAFGTATAAADKFKEAQKNAQEATDALSQSVESDIEKLIFDRAKLKDVLRETAQSLGKDMLKAELTGTGPFAGVMGTSAGDNPVQGGGPTGLLNRMFAPLQHHLAGGAVKPTGAKGDPIYVRPEDGRPLGEASPMSRAYDESIGQVSQPASPQTVSQIVDAAQARDLTPNVSQLTAPANDNTTLPAAASAFGSAGPSVTQLVNEAGGGAPSLPVSSPSALASAFGAGPGGGGPLMGGGPSIIGSLFGGSGSGDASAGGGGSGGAGGAGGLVSGMLNEGIGIAQRLSKSDSGTGKPDGSAANPFHVVMAGGKGGGGSGGGSGGLDNIMQSLMGGDGRSGGGAAFPDGDGAGGASGGDTAQDSGGADALFLHRGTSSVGMAAPSVNVSPRLFINAPRLHSGLAHDEFPAILQRGESVTPKGSRGMGGTTVNLHVHGVTDPGAFNRSGGQIEREIKRRVQS